MLINRAARVPRLARSLWNLRELPSCRSFPQGDATIDSFDFNGGNFLRLILLGLEISFDGKSIDGLPFNDNCAI